ncbi:MAG: hypothetical protein HY669_04600 [Chloroflexi bacterium]|nr:hypothetical protein [Chloroflexota bacterium]
MAVRIRIFPIFREQPRRGAVKADHVVRFDIHQRLQHITMMSSFTLLALTGLPLKFHDAAVSQWWVALWGGVESTRAVHHFAAWVMAFACVYHLGYIGFTTVVLKRPFPVEMIPSPKDFFDLLHDLRYYFGLSPERARYGRFNYREKFDYWAVFWGIFIMAGSGFVLMFPVLVSRFLPGWIVPTALVAHSDEAILAVSWIVIVHLFFAHLAPNIFPFNKSIFTGKVPRERYQHEHPLEYKRMTEAAEEGRPEEE